MADSQRPVAGEAAPARAGIDPRGPRFAAGLTSAVLALAFVTDSPWVLAFQVAVFGIGAALGVQRGPYGVLFRRFLRPRMEAPAELEDPRPPRFAQAVGFVITGLGLVLVLAGIDIALEIAVGLAFVAAALNATIGFCLGCEIYLLVVRLRGPRTA